MERDKILPCEPKPPVGTITRIVRGEKDRRAQLVLTGVTAAAHLQSLFTMVLIEP
ncbi:MAG: hypothetical protein ACOC9Y_02805 [Chloroflexota bacterium]